MRRVAVYGFLLSTTRSPITARMRRSVHLSRRIVAHTVFWRSVVAASRSIGVVAGESEPLWSKASIRWTRVVCSCTNTRQNTLTRSPGCSTRISAIRRIKLLELNVDARPDGWSPATSNRGALTRRPVSGSCGDVSYPLCSNAAAAAARKTSRSPFSKCRTEKFAAVGACVAQPPSAAIVRHITNEPRNCFAHMASLSAPSSCVRTQIGRAGNLDAVEAAYLCTIRPSPIEHPQARWRRYQKTQRPCPNR